MIRPLLPLLLLLVGTASLRAENDEVTTSPHKTFKIVQHRDGDSVKQTIQFTKEPNRVVTLEEDLSWAADYYISPDEQWILRIQKVGSGDNIAFLYHLDEQGCLWRKEEQIGELGFAYLAKQPGVPHDLYHQGIEFKSWDLKAGLLHFIISGSDANQSGNAVHRSLIYNLRDEAVTAP